MVGIREIPHDLVERVESGTGPDYELERDVGLAIGTWEWVTAGGATMLRCDGEVFPDHEGALYPSLLQSLDTVVSLIEQKLPGCKWLVVGYGGEKPDEAAIKFDERFHRIDASAHSPTRALLAACLRAIQAQAETLADAHQNPEAEHG